MGARFVSYADESGDSFFLFYEVIRQNKKGKHMLTLVCIMLLMGFQKGSHFAPLIPGWLVQLGSVLLSCLKDSHLIFFMI